LKVVKLADMKFFSGKNYRAKAYEKKPWEGKKREVRKGKGVWEWNDVLIKKPFLGCQDHKPLSVGGGRKLDAKEGLSGAESGMSLKRNEEKGLGTRQSEQQIMVQKTRIGQLSTTGRQGDIWNGNQKRNRGWRKGTRGGIGTPGEHRKRHVQVNEEKQKFSLPPEMIGGPSRKEVYRGLQNLCKGPNPTSASGVAGGGTAAAYHREIKRVVKDDEKGTSPE